MSKTVKPIRPNDLTYEMRKVLTLYHQHIMDEVDAAGEDAVKDLVKKTKATAPVASGEFRENIAWKKLVGKFAGTRYVWYVKPPLHRITHLLAHGHATRNGGRTKADPFLKNALSDVLPEYENKVKTAVANCSDIERLAKEQKEVEAMLRL